MGLLDWLLPKSPPEKKKKPENPPQQEKEWSYQLVHPRDEFISKFLSASSEAVAVKGDAEKLRRLERLLPDFPSFIRFYFICDGNLPDTIYCRDMLPELYMRYGLWEKAEKFMRLCISCKAYGHTEYTEYKENHRQWIAASGAEELEQLQRRHEAADALLAYLAENPGQLQNKVYKLPELAAIDHEALV